MYRTARFCSPCVGLLIVGSLGLAGCGAKDLQDLQQASEQATTVITQASAARTQVQKQLTTLPADDPIRQRLEPQLAALDKIVTQAQSYLPAIDAALKSAQSGQIDPSLQQAVAAIPYGSLALALVGVVFGAVKHVKAGTLVDQQQQTQKAFEQVVTALDAALPTPTPDQQAKLEGVLDTDVKAKIAAVRVG